MLGGIDIGTTRCKMTVYEDSGMCLYCAYCDYPVSRSIKEHEVNAECIWSSVKEVIAKAASKYPEISAIGITSFGESCVLLDAQDQPIRPVMLYTDPRGSKECEELTRVLGSEAIEKIAGVKPHSMYSLPKVMWIKENKPEEYARTKHILMMEDYIIYMLTGNAIIDYSLAARSMAFDISKLQWSEEIFRAAEVDRALFSTPVISGTCAGTIKKTLAEKWGLKKDVLIVPAGHDQVAAAIGSGVFETDSAVDGAGTVECITPVYDGIPKNGNMGKGNYAVVPYIIPGRYVTYAFSYTGGALIAWYIDQMAKSEKGQAKELGISVYEVLEKGMKDEPTGILVLPHFAGAATPYMDIHSKGAVIGLTVEHTTSDLYRAMMEGVVYEMKLNLEYLEMAGIRPKKLHAAGGGAASKVWMQMKADILNLPVTSLGSIESGTSGCAMMAGIAAGVFQNLKEAAQALIREKETYYPRKEQYEAYQKEYERYRKVYDAVRPLV